MVFDYHFRLPHINISRFNNKVLILFCWPHVPHLSNSTHTVTDRHSLSARLLWSGCLLHASIIFPTLPASVSSTDATFPMHQEGKSQWSHYLHENKIMFTFQINQLRDNRLHKSVLLRPRQQRELKSWSHPFPNLLWKSLSNSKKQENAPREWTSGAVFRKQRTQRNRP